MSIIPVKSFINNQIPIIYNRDLFSSSGISSDNVNTLSLNVSGSSYLNTLNTTGLISSININNSSLITSGAITNNGALISNTITSSGLVTCNNGLTVTAGTISLPANSLKNADVNGLGTTLGKLLNLTGSVAVVSTITSNVLTINYTNNNGQTIFVTPTANFSLVLTNVSTSSVNAIYKLEIYCSARFYCNAITVNGTVINMVSLGGFSNIASNVNVNATGLIQQFTIFFTGTTTPSRVNTMLFSTW